MKENEKLAALARLASTDAASMKQEDMKANTFQQTMDEYDAIVRLMDKYLLTRVEADNLRNSMVAHLQKSDLTLNFRASELFDNKLKGGIMNTFERPGHSAGGYLNTRNDTEENLFGYTQNNHHKGVAQGAFDRMKKFGSLTNNVDFAPSMRPKYGALNFTNHKFGAAPLYGKSYMVLREHVKHNSTYTDRDSFNYTTNANGGAKVATYTNMDRIIANLNDRMLENLYRMIIAPSLQFHPVGYVEAQIHGEIKFSRDVAKMYIDNTDVTISTNTKVRDHIDKFSRKYGIPTVYR